MAHCDEKNMDNERVLIIGPSAFFRKSALISGTHLEEFNVIILHPSIVSKTFEGSPGQKTANAIEAHITKLLDWVKRGNSLIILDAPPLPFHFEYVEFPSRSKKIYEPLKAEPFVGIQFMPADGQLIEFCGPPSVEPVMALMIPDMRYQAILQSKTLSPLLRVSRGQRGREQIVGGFKRVGSGFIIFVPPCRDEKYVDRYHDALASLPEHLAITTQGLPAWAASFQTTDEQVACRKITRLNETIFEIRSQISEQDAVVASVQSLKQLFAGSGDEFADAVEEALRELGAKVVKGPGHRADLIAFDGRRLAAIEAKGLEGGSKEANLRQTERWVADVRSALVATAEEKSADVDLAAYTERLVELGVPIGSEDAAVECKGIMVIGTYRKTPISDRKAPNFSEPLERTINRSEVCALSGLQLLGLLLKAREDQSQGAIILELLFSTNGVLNECVDWTEFLHT
jgi:hypothetical protein